MAGGIVGVLGMGATAYATGLPSHTDLERPVTHVNGVAGAAHPLRVDRWGSRHCRLPMGGSCPESHLLYSSGPLSTEQYRLQWASALEKEGWRRHRDTSDGDGPDATWWTKDKMVVQLIKRGDGWFGPYFEWASGNLVVNVFALEGAGSAWSQHSVASRKNALQ